MAVPTLDLVLHNLVAVGLMVVVLMLLSQLLLAPILAISARLLRSSLFKELTDEDRAAFRRRLRRGAIVIVALLSVALFVGSLFASSFGIRALDLTKSGLTRLREQELATVGARLPKALAIVVCGLIVDAIVRSFASVLGKALKGSVRFDARREPLAEAIKRLRTALRTTILCGTAVLVASTLALSEGFRGATNLVAYVLVAFYASRLLVAIGHLAVDLLFDLSGKFALLESPLKYLGSLTHLAGITKRALEYFIYVGATTWVADELTPNTWPAKAGRIGIRVIAIFYASRVVVEVCLLFVNELFLSKATGRSESELQQRKTLVPVAMGLLRYGIYFGALVMVLREANVDPTPLLAGAGVLGVAVGLGAQAFVGDIVAGFFILFENLLLVGDLVEVSGVRGVVEEIGVRITKIRDDSGVLHAIPNGEVRKVSSHSKDYVNAVVDVYVPYEEDLRRVRALLTTIAEGALEGVPGARKAAVEVKVQQLGEGSVMFRVVARCPPGKDEDLGDALRAAVLDGLHDAGIAAPRPRRAVMIDDAEMRIAAPPLPKKVEEKGPPSPFKPPGAES